MVTNKPIPRHPALTDELTGLPNQLHFETVHQILFEGAGRGLPLTLAMVEASTSTDMLLRDVGQRLAEAVRTADLLAHLGEGRFVAVLSGSNIFGGRNAAERLGVALDPLAGESDLTYAIGIATYRAEMRGRGEVALFAAAEAAVAEARARGGGLEIGAK